MLEERSKCKERAFSSDIVGRGEAFFAWWVGASLRMNHTDTNVKVKMMTRRPKCISERRHTINTKEYKNRVGLPSSSYARTSRVMIQHHRCRLASDLMGAIAIVRPWSKPIKHGQTACLGCAHGPSRSIDGPETGRRARKGSGCWGHHRIARERIRNSNGQASISYIGFRGEEDTFYDRPVLRGHLARLLCVSSKCRSPLSPPQMLISGPI